MQPAALNLIPPMQVKILCGLKLKKIVEKENWWTYKLKRLQLMESFNLKGADDSQNKARVGWIIFSIEGNSRTWSFSSFHSDVPDVDFSTLLWRKYPNQTEELSSAVFGKKSLFYHKSIILNILYDPLKKKKKALSSSGRMFSKISI